MAIEYAIRDGVVWTRASGVLDDAGLLAHVQRLLRDPEHGPAVPELFDAGAVTAIEVTGSGAREVAALLRHAPGQPSAKLAVVVNTTVAFGMARMYGLLRDDIDVAIFEDRAQAVAWLSGHAP